MTHNMVKKSCRRQKLPNKDVLLPPNLTEEDENDHVKIRKLNVCFRTKAQEELWNLIDDKEITIIAGSAGTGKSFISILKALCLLQQHPYKYKKIFVVTPAVEADEKSLGAMPGLLDEKLAPYMYSIKYLFTKILGVVKTNRMFERKQVEILAMSFMRGVNIDDAILICDEFQNCTPRQAKTLLTRIGENAKFIINGDYSQSDRYKNCKESGLYVSMERLRNIPQIGIFEFSDDDIVRNDIIKVILQRFNTDTL